MLRKLQKRNEGFTIIEVLIVLAIAGLILLIVFLAVPALQRNARNTQRKNDVASILGAINEYTNNNGGTIPNTGAQFTTALGNAKISHYPQAQVYLGTTAPAIPSPILGGAGSATVVTTDDVIILFGFDCGNGATGIPTAASSRSIAAVFAVETGGKPLYQCQAS